MACISGVQTIYMMFRRLKEFWRWLQLRATNSLLSPDSEPLPDDEVDNASFWFRRFITSLSLGHGAGLLSVLTLATSSWIEDQQARLAWPFLFFATGVVAAGAAPLLLIVRHRAARPRVQTNDNASLEADPSAYSLPSPVVQWCWYRLRRLLFMLSALCAAALFIAGLVAYWCLFQSSGLDAA